MHIVICIICFIAGIWIEYFMMSTMINGKPTLKCSTLKFKTKNGKDQYLLGPNDKHDFATIIYSLNENIYGEVVTEIDKEN